MQLALSICRVAPQPLAGDDRNVTNDITRQDAIILNIQRACEASIDLARHLVRRERLRIPQESREAFDLLVGGGRLTPALAEPLKRMVGFRNIAVHDYQKLSLDVVLAIIARNLDDLLAFARHAVKTID